MPLNDAQKSAVEYLDGPLIVLAGPGTGKTQLLSSKVEYILKNTDASPESILCLTFTESGADNMRERLYSMIGTAASKVHISTYHAFGSNVIHEYKNYAEHFDRNLDSAIDEVNQYKIIASIQKSLDAFDILKHANISDIISTISSAKSARLTGKDLEKIAKDNIAVSEELNHRLGEILLNVRRGMKFHEGVTEVYGPLLEALSTTTKPEPICVNIDREVNFLTLELNSIIEAESAKEKPSISPLTTWKNKRFEKDDAGNFRLANRVANKKLLSLAHVMQEYEKYLADSGLYDFDDMIQQAIQILATDKGFKLTLEERYQYILLDEFQDTNAAQLELIKHITDYEKPVIMAVGDDDQAIFAFQGANVSNLIDFKNHYDAKVITLTDNYRSGESVLDFSYQIREQVSDSFARAQQIDKKLIAKKPELAEISRHEFLESSAEYAWVAEQIAALVKSGVKQSQIAIITPKHKYIETFLPHLKSYDFINIAYEKRDNLFEDPRIHEILTLSRFIYELSLGQNPAHLLFEVLTFPFLEISPLDAVRAINKVPRKFTLDYLLESDVEDLRNFGLFVAELATKSQTAPLELFLDYLIGTVPYSDDKRSRFLEFYANSESPDNYSAFSLYENLAVLREAVIKHKTQNEKVTLKDLIAFEDDYLTAGAALNNTSPYQDADEAVQILTAHKSKGLEFEYVFIIATDDRAWGNAKGNNNMLALPQNVVSIRHTGITEDERLRLFFVAVTRAKTHLIITNSVKDFSGKSPARLQYLAEHEEDGKIISPLLSVESQVVTQHYGDATASKSEIGLRSTWISTYQKSLAELRPILEKRLENYRLNATDLTSFIDIAYSGPQTFYKQKVLRAPDETYSLPLTFGNLIHATFEQVTTNHLTDDEAREYYINSLRASAVAEEDFEDLLTRGTKSLDASLKTFGQLLRDENARAEVNLAHDHLMLNGTPLTGKIDHINIHPETKTIDVYDFKTADFRKENWDRHPTLFKYKLQLGFYKLLLNLSPEFSKYKVERAHILFVVPDALDAKVHDKVYEYNERDEELLKNLCATVYQQIKTLSFVDDEELFIAPDKGYTIKDILDFVQLVLDKSA